MAALVQAYPQQTGTMTMLQRPGSASANYPGGQGQNQPYGVPQGQRNSFYGASGNVNQPVYRMSSAPIQPYAFTSTPGTHSNAQWQSSSAHRATSSSAVPTMHGGFDSGSSSRSRYPASVSMTNLPSFSAGYEAVGSRDDSNLAVGGRRNPSAPRPQSAHLFGTTATATQVTFTQATPIRVSPDRYRRHAPRVVDATQPRQQTSAQPSGAGMATVNHLYNPHAAGDQRLAVPRSRTSPSNNSRPTSLYSATHGSSTDDFQVQRQPSPEEVRRLKRRSMPALDSAGFSKASTPHESKQPEESAAQKADDSTNQKATRAPAPASKKDTAEASATRASNGSSESLISNRSHVSRPSSATNRNPSAPAGNPAALTSAADHSKPENAKLVSIPPRTSSSDVSKSINPSPLSKPVTMNAESELADKSEDSPQRPPNGDSPAVQQLSAISKKSGKSKSKTSRLRRAFSFGSAAELRKAAGGEYGAETSQAGAKLQKQPGADAYDAEQARIAQQQEEGGIGNSIYAGAKIFSASTDNLSISSTASSASIMIRKMGRGMKKGGRSLVGLFRPKSIIGAPVAESQLQEASQPSVSMITVEAERERVNVNANPHDQNGGGTGFPRLERNSIDASRAGSSSTDNSGARKSIVGGDKERAEVLAAVRTKGILKRRGVTPSPPRGNNLPGVPPMSDSPNSSAPSTPNDEAQGHKRNGSVAIGSEDYFMTALRLRQDTRSAPVTPQGNTPTGTLRRNATFSPRIVFYDTWPSQEYDRRGEIATCNRLTPMLAQQIKEEINSFKMEMEVHENSKIYTQFF